MIQKYIIHSENLTQRKKYIDSLRLKNVKYVCGFPAEKMTEEVVNNIYDPSPEKWKEKTNGLAMSEYRTLNIRDLSCLSKHISCYNQIKNSTYISGPFGLIFEDDFLVNTSQNINEAILDIYDRMPDDCDVLFLGGSFPHEKMETINIKNTNFYLKDHPATNCCFAYIISTNAARQLVEKLDKVTLPIDFELNYWFKELDLNIYHYIPYIIKEGSACGVYPTSVKE